MDDEQSLQSPPRTTEEEAPAAPVTEVPETEVQAAPDADVADVDVEVATAQAEAQAVTEAEADGLPHGSIAAVGERLGQRVAQVGEAAGDKVAHAVEVAAERVQHVGEVAAERVAQASEAAGQKVILASEAAEGTVAEAQTRAVQAKQRLVEQVGHLTRRIRGSAPAPVRETGARAVEAVRKNPRKALAGSALVGIVAAVRRRGRHTDGTD